MCEGNSMNRRFCASHPSLVLLAILGVFGGGVAWAETPISDEAPSLAVTMPEPDSELFRPQYGSWTETMHVAVPPENSVPSIVPVLAKPSAIATSTPAPQEQPSYRAQDLLPTAPSPSVSPPAAIAQTSDTFGQPQSPGVFREARENIDSVRFSIFNWLAPTTVLQGTARRRVVTTSIKSTGIALLGSVVAPLGEDTHIGLVLEGGETILAFDLGIISASEQPRSGFGANIFGQRSHLGTYQNGDNEIDLPNGETAWIHRLGGGVEYYLPFASNFESAFGVSYQRVSVRDDFFSDDIFAEDEEGNALTVDSDGLDDLLTLNFAATLDNRDSPNLTTDGDLLRFGVNQGFNLGTEENAYTQFTGYYARYIPVDFFGFDEGPRVLILNVQGGLGLGDVPSYEGFNIGGRTSVRGYASGEISTAASFFQATAEYRFPVAQFDFRDRPVTMRGVLFADYATDFGTADEVIGQPAEARDKPGDGFGFGAGLHTVLGDFFNRFEIGVADNGDVDVILTFGDRF